MEWLLRTWDDPGEIGVNSGLDVWGRLLLQCLLFLPLGATLRLELAFLLFGQLSLPFLMCLRSWSGQESPLCFDHIP